MSRMFGGCGERTLSLRGIIGARVLDINRPHQLGIISNALIDPSALRIVYFELQHGDGHLYRIIPAGLAERIVPNTLLVRDSNDIDFQTPPNVEEGLFNLDVLTRRPVMDEDGTPVGRITDARFDPSNLRIESYVLAKPFWAVWRRRPRVNRDDVVSSTPEVLVVPAKDELPQLAKGNLPTRASQTSSTPAAESD